MSKAFVSEDAATEEELPEEPDPEGPALITADGHRRMLDEQARLREVERPALLATIEQAKQRAEAVPLQALEQQRRKLDRRLRYLARRLAVLEVVPAPAQYGRVGFGARVTVEDEDGKATIYRVVGPDEVDPERGWLGVTAPLARALLGREVGDEVTVRRPRGPLVLVVTDVRYGDG